MRWIVSCVAGCAAGCGAAGELDSATPAPPPVLNARVLELIADYPAGGFGGYAWPAPAGTAGTTRDLRLGDDVIARGGAGNHCVGVTLEVMWRTLEACPGDAFDDAAAARRFKRLWYVPALYGTGAAEALPAHHLGTRVMDLDDAMAGDFVQAWRADGLGHSMVFLGWDRDVAGEINGIRYWSSQPWTDGIGEASSTIGAAADSFDPAQVHVARAACR